VKKAFELCATGLHQKADVLRKITALGLRTIIIRESPLTAQTFQELLRKPIYTGLIAVPSWGIVAKGVFQPLITEETFNRVQAVLDGRPLTVTPHLRNNPDFPLRRFATCADCGTPITGSWSEEERAVRLLLLPER
jgi:site-specific DNA recombinase